jgi:ABC-2 type transport system ATP-binding protein
MGRALVKNIILDLKSRGKCVFFSTHITADVESVCDRVGIIFKGELKSVERVEDIMTAGIVGYIVRTRNTDGKVEEHNLEKHRLGAFITERTEAGDQVTLVEPKRKNLEDFFLGIIKVSDAGSL